MGKVARKSAENPSETAPESLMLLGKRADELSWLIERQFAPIFEARGIVVPVRSCSLLLHLGQAETASAADLARALGQSHQLVLQKIPVLLGRGLIERRRDPEDRRRRVFRLTSDGHRQVTLITEQSTAIGQLYQELYREIGVDLFDAIGRALTALRKRNLSDRLATIE